MQFFLGLHPEQYALIENQCENTHFLTVERTDFLWIKRDIFDAVYLPMDYFLNVLGVEEIPEEPLLMQHHGKITVDAPYVISSFRKNDIHSSVLDSSLVLVRAIIKTIHKHNDTHVGTPAQQIHSMGFYQNNLFEQLTVAEAKKLITEIALMMDAVN